jgi:hypothetical protein
MRTGISAATTGLGPIRRGTSRALLQRREGLGSQHDRARGPQRVSADDEWVFGWASRWDPKPGPYSISRGSSAFEWLAERMSMSRECRCVTHWRPASASTAALAPMTRSCQRPATSHRVAPAPRMASRSLQDAGEADRAITHPTRPEVPLAEPPYVLRLVLRHNQPHPAPPTLLPRIFAAPDQKPLPIGPPDSLMTSALATPAPRSERTAR